MFNQWNIITILSGATTVFVVYISNMVKIGIVEWQQNNSPNH